MVRRMKKTAVLLLGLLLLLPLAASAQTASSAVLSPPNTQDFPEISASLKVFDGQGAFAHNLTVENITIAEDSRPLPLTALQEQHPGAQFVLALSLERAFAIRDSHGISRYDNILTALTEWADAQPANASDNLSLVTADGYEAAHVSTAADWLDALTAYDVDPRAAEPSLDALSRAIDIAADPTPRPGMGRSILFLTPNMPRENVGALESLLSRAQQEGVVINIWLVGSPAYFDSEFAQKLAETAAHTGGQLFTYSGEEPLPNPDSYLEPLRHIYNLTYQSKIRDAGIHQVAARIELDDLTIRSEPQTFDLQVLPPNPILVSPPQQIVRADRRDFSATMHEAEPDYTPKSQAIEIVVEFPDGYSRPLVRTSLYVDGQLADENTAPPFDTFTWNLDGYQASGEHILQVEAVDALGLSSVTIETPVQITVQQTPQTVAVTLARNGPLIAGVLAAIAGGVLLLVLIVGGHIRPREFGRQNGNGKSRKSRREIDSDPVTQPVPVRPATVPGRSRFGWVSRFSWPQRRGAAEAPAYLEPLDGSAADDPLNRIPLDGREISIGRDPKRVMIALTDASISAMHANLRRTNGLFVIQDAGSQAGTWVNYEPVAPEGTPLHHGDIIHLGRVALSIAYSDANRIPKVTILNLENWS